MSAAFKDSFPLAGVFDRVGDSKRSWVALQHYPRLCPFRREARRKIRPIRRNELQWDCPKWVMIAGHEMKRAYQINSRKFCHGRNVALNNL
jgi:hypothetical protein